MMMSGGAGRPLLAALPGLLVGLGGLVAANPARAAIRYADPSSETITGACMASAPCTVGYAIRGAGVGDEVVVRPGDYGSNGARMTSAIAATAPRIYIHGTVGKPRPRLYFSVARYALSLTGPATVSDLEIDNSAGDGRDVGQGTDANLGSLVERVAVSAAGAGSFSCALAAGVIRDSLCLSEGARSQAVHSGPSSDATVSVRNARSDATTGTRDNDDMSPLRRGVRTARALASEECDRSAGTRDRRPRTAVWARAAARCCDRRRLPS
jgi:hypothetical protein